MNHESQYTVSYTHNGEWLQLETGPTSGPVASMRPESGDDDIVFVGLADGTQVATSEPGTFRIDAPYDRPFEDWKLTILGLHRIYEQLKMPVIGNLFGSQGAALIRQAYISTRPHSENISDYRARLALPSQKEALATTLPIGHLTAPVMYSINNKTRQARIEHTNKWQMTPERGYIIPRSALTKVEDTSEPS